MVEISTSILSVKKGEESNTFFELERAKTDYFHIDVMDGKFVEKNTYKKMTEYAAYIKRISNLPLDVHLMVEDIDQAIEDFLSVDPNIITFHYEACKDKEEEAIENSAWNSTLVVNHFANFHAASILASLPLFNNQTDGP